MIDNDESLTISPARQRRLSHSLASDLDGGSWSDMIMARLPQPREKQKHPAVQQVAGGGEQDDYKSTSQQ